MTMDPHELRAALEAILFASGEPVKTEDLYDAFADEGHDAVEAQLEEIRRSFEERQGGFVLEKAAGGYRFATRAELDPHLRKFFARKNEGRLSMAALETLAIIAYRQPVTVPEINDLRGVNSTGVIRTLLDRKMIKIAGRKNVVGSPFLYRTTKDFLVHFGLESIQDLPRLEEFTEILGENLGEELLAPPVPEGEDERGSGEDETPDSAPEDPWFNEGSIAEPEREDEGEAEPDAEEPPPHGDVLREEVVSDQDDERVL